MIAPFVLHQPRSVEAVVSLLAAHAEDAKLLAGGSALVPTMKLGAVRPKYVVDIKGIDDLRRIDFDASARRLRVGPLTTYRDLERSSTVREHLALLADAAGKVGNVRLRAVGTLGGNLCAADPRSDPGTLLLACDAVLKAASARGERTIQMRDFLVDSYETALKPDEVLTEIQISQPACDVASAYVRCCPGGVLFAAVAVRLGLAGGVCTHVRLAASVGRVPARLTEVEDSLVGLPIDEIRADAWRAGERAGAACRPLDDFRASIDYKRHVVKVLVSRALSDVCGAETGRG